MIEILCVFFANEASRGLRFLEIHIDRRFAIINSTIVEFVFYQAVDNQAVDLASLTGYVV